jgi:salicylate hydroxylase
MHVIIVGAGIAGLTAAIALRHHGINATVLEQAKALTEIGAGIQIASNGAVVLRHLGLEEQLAAKGVIPQSYDFRDLETGKMLFAVPLGTDAAERYGAPLYNVHRADLIDILTAALPSDAIRFNAKCIGVEQDDAGVSVKLTSGETIRGDALIGADGIHSFLRERLRGPEQTNFANILMWRALIPAERLQSTGLEERGNYWFGPGRTLITYWVRPGKLYSILGSVPAAEVQRESWTESGDIEELHRSFQGAEPRVQRMLEAIDSGFITGMYYRDPIDSWTEGRITLMGDAAHPMVPFLAQGACQGIEDAWTLAAVLAQRGEKDIPGALVEYEQRRRPRTTRVQAGARAMVKLVHESDPSRIQVRNGRWKGMSRIDPLAETTWAFVWDYNVLNAVQEPAGNVLGLASAREGKQMKRPESQRAFDMWKHTFTAEDVARGHDGLRDGYERFLTTNFPPPADLQVTELELNGVKALRVPHPSGVPAATVLHFHGGGYVIGSAKGSLEYSNRLAKAVNGESVTVEYRLAPEHPYPAAIDDAMDAYRGLISQGVPASQIILSGESSGAGLAIALAMALRDAAEPLPAGIIAVCPFADLTLSGPSVRQYAGEDPAANRDSLAFLAASYFQGHEPTDPRVSPLYGDFAGIPPIFLTATEGEVLLSDATRLAGRAEKAGTGLVLRIVDDSVHVFPIFPFLPESATTLSEIGVWAAARLAKAAPLPAAEAA